MQTPMIVIEPTDSAIKIVVGYVVEHEPIVLYATIKSIHDLIKNGNIVDIKSLSNVLKNISHVEDKRARVRFAIRSAVLLLPPVGLEIYEDKKMTSVISNDSKIQPIDLSNIFAMIRKSKIKKDNSFVDIIPIVYYLSDGIATNKLPLGRISDYLGMKAIIYTLPDKLFKGYKASLESAGIKVKKCVIAPCAIAHLLAHEKETPAAYLYVDVGSTYTSISLISKTYVYNSSYFAIGGDDLTNAISETFRIDVKEAEKLKRRYGYQTRLISFNPTICNAKTSDGQEALYTVQDLNRVIKDYLDNYIYAFDTCLSKLLSAYPENKRNFPIIFGGAASRLDGFLTFVKTKYPNHDIRQIPLKIVGARHEKYLNCIGALLAASSYMGSSENNRLNNANNQSNLDKLSANKGANNGAR
ncbi:MAG: hypothetical protein MJ208_00540 [Bacilli bacterium]|nr:hypothetical protein [Bacilli bacterium]